MHRYYVPYVDRDENKNYLPTALRHLTLKQYFNRSPPLNNTLTKQNTLGTKIGQQTRYYKCGKGPGMKKCFNFVRKEPKEHYLIHVTTLNLPRNLRVT